MVELTCVSFYGDWGDGGRTGMRSATSDGICLPSLSFLKPETWS